jgi:hypothetical protein
MHALQFSCSLVNHLVNSAYLKKKILQRSLTSERCKAKKGGLDLPEINFLITIEMC